MASDRIGFAWRARDGLQSPSYTTRKLIASYATAHYYNELIEVWERADPELQDRVRAARAAPSAVSPDRSASIVELYKRAR